MRAAYGILMRMKGGLRPNRAGYTIVEVMIVLAVSGLLFVSTAFFIAGRQRTTEFDQSIHDIQSELQQTISEVSTGYYPNAGNFNCTVSAIGPKLSTNAGAGQGSNYGCIFLGKAIQFKVGSGKPEQYNTFSIAGLQKRADGTESQSLTDALPALIAKGTTSSADMPDDTTTATLEYGLTTASMVSDDGTTTPIGAIAFVSSLASYNASNNIASGSQQVTMVPITGTALGATKAAMVDAINANLAASTPSPKNGVKICFASGGTNASGLITIGGSGTELAVKLKIYSGNTTCS